MELLPNSMSFRVINTIDITDDNEIPADFTGRVRRSFDSAQRYVAWYTGGHLDDPTKGYPAYRVHRSDGQVKYEMHYRNGVLDDPDAAHARRPRVLRQRRRALRRALLRRPSSRRPRRIAAVRKWRADGTLRHELHYRHGSRLR